MNPEDRLRQAIEARTSRVEPSGDALPDIQEKLEEARRHDARTRVLLAVGAAVFVVAVLVAGALVVTDRDPVATEDTTTTTSETTTTSTTTTTTESTTTTTTFTPTVDPAVPVWPRVASSQRFDDPVSAARSFAVDFVGMIDPVVGAFQAGDARSGEVPVQPRADGPVTTILVRQLEDDTWFVLGAGTDDIRLDTPTAGTQIDCPLRLTGEALAYEGTVQVSIRADAADEPIGTGFVTGGGGPSAPFDGTVGCDLGVLDDGVHHGAVVLSTYGGEDDRIWDFTVTRVALK